MAATGSSSLSLQRKDHTCKCKCSYTCIYLDIVMPPKMRKRGRPKGNETTVIGLPNKRSKTKGKLQPFIKLHVSVKEKSKFYCYIIDKLYFHSYVEVVCGL